MGGMVWGIRGGGSDACGIAMHTYDQVYDYISVPSPMKAAKYLGKTSIRKQNDDSLATA